MGSKVAQLLRYFLVDRVFTDVKLFFWSAVKFSKKNRATVWLVEKFLS